MYTTCNELYIYIKTVGQSQGLGADWFLLLTDFKWTNGKERIITYLVVVVQVHI
jgi:hypothetical protein